MAGEIEARVTWRDRMELRFLRLAAGGWVPARWFRPDLPPESARAARRGRLRVEIVSHCWGYSHLLAYQLSSLVRHPPTCVDVTMTVFHAAEDADTVARLAWFGARTVPGVTWNWRCLERSQLFRRAIGRNLAARSTSCDWIWFTDCDVIFEDGCLDGLAEALQGRREALLFPRQEFCTPPLQAGDPLLEAGRGEPRILDIDPGRFVAVRRDRATGPLQITHGDVARAAGYCDSLRVYQKPWPHFAKCEEDRAFRWMLGTQGVAIDVPGVHRIQHVGKGRYHGSAFVNGLRTLGQRFRIRRQG